MRINNYEIESKKNMVSISDKTIAIVSDIQINNNTTEEKIESVIETVKNIRPTEIIIPGNLYNIDKNSEYFDERNAEKVKKLLKKLSKLAEVFVSYGNKELELEEVGLKEESRKIRKDINEFAYDHTKYCANSINVFDNIFYCEELIYNYDMYLCSLISEFDFYEEAKKSIDKFIELYESYLVQLTNMMDQNLFNVLICHNPIIIEAYEKMSVLKRFDLVICGNKQGYIFNRYKSGLIRQGKTDFLVCDTVTKDHLSDKILRQEGAIDVVKIKRKL